MSDPKHLAIIDAQAETIRRLEASNAELLEALRCVMATHQHDEIPCDPPNPDECGLCYARELIARGDEARGIDPGAA